MARCIIITPLYSGEEQEWLMPAKGDLLICADGGYRAAVRRGLIPHLTIGDFDSMPVAEVQGEIVQLPVHKDDTDLVVCLREGRSRGYREFVVAGCLGGRFDHTLACLQSAADCAIRGESAWLCDSQNRVTILAPGTYTLPRIHDNRKLSFLSYTPEVKGITLEGTLWELENATLTSSYPLGCSNEWIADCAKLTFTEGLLVVCCSGDAR